jgi:hypothetical protein
LGEILESQSGQGWESGVLGGKKGRKKSSQEIMKHKKAR